MKIDAFNGEIINTKDIYFHDCIIDKMCFDRMQSKMTLYALTENCNDHFLIEFCDVIGFEMTSCSFWGESPHILDFEYVDFANQILVEKLFDMKTKNDCPFCRLKDKKQYIETVMLFTSGDELRVACESIYVANKK